LTAARGRRAAWHFVRLRDGLPLPPLPPPGARHPRINLSKSGSSLSLGRRGVMLNFSKRGTRATVGLPGTGLSYSDMLSSGPQTALPADDRSAGLSRVWLIISLVALATVLGLAVSG
jgi:Protein of unknown function (DUF4236)